MAQEKPLKSVLMASRILLWLILVKCEALIKQSKYVLNILILPLPICY